MPPPEEGATKLRHLEDAIAAMEVTLGEDEVALSGGWLGEPRLTGPTA